MIDRHRKVGMNEQKFLIGGDWRTGQSMTVIKDVYTDSVLAHVHQASSADAEAAVCSAHEAFKTTSQYSSLERAEILRSIAEQIAERKEEFALTITRESGKPITFSRAEVDRAVTTFVTASEETIRISGEIIPLDSTPAGKGRSGYIQHFPIGIILCIAPFNFPLNLVAHKIAPAIASGNSFILKPPPQTPLTSLMLGEVLLNSGLASSAVNVVPMDNSIAEHLAADDRIAMLSFTGSAKVGWMLKSKASKKKVLLELGGNAAAIIDASADIPHAVSRCVLGAFGYSGQVCIKVQRIILHKSIAEDFTKQFLAAAQQVMTGDPNIAGTISGPMISEQEAIRVESWVKEAVDAGAVVLTGGNRSGKFYAPTVLTGVNASMKVCSEEIFGPVVTLETVSSIEEAVQHANDTKYGLQAGIFSNEHQSIQCAYKNLKVGGVIVNDHPTFRVDSMPYGGVKDSGLGREGVRYAMFEMLEKKLLVM